MCQLLQSDHLVTSGELSLRKHLLSATLSELVDCCHGQASRVCEYFLRAKDDNSSIKMPALDNTLEFSHNSLKRDTPALISMLWKCLLLFGILVMGQHLQLLCCKHMVNLQLITSAVTGYTNIKATLNLSAHLRVFQKAFLMVAGRYIQNIKPSWVKLRSMSPFLCGASIGCSGSGTHTCME